MSVGHPTAPVRPRKPTDDFPLFAHATGRWAKKIKGKLVYFGAWDDPLGALERYNAFLAGTPIVNPKRTPPPAVPRPAKPYPDFPLYAHASGRWAKKIRNVIHYFGPWSDPDAALQTYLDQRDALYAERTVRPERDDVKVKDIANHFLAFNTTALRQLTSAARFFI